MTDYKILQNIDLAQNEIKEVSKIANDRQDGEDKGLLIQTGDNTSLTFKRKLEKENSINYIKGAVIDGADEERKESVFTLEPSKVSISNTIGATTLTESRVVLGLNSETKEHIEAVSPLVDIKTGNEGYTDPHISLKRDKSILEIQSSTVKIDSRETPKSGSLEESSLKKSSLKMNEGITGVSNNIFLKNSNENVYLHLESDGINGTILESANTSITEEVDKVSIALVKDKDTAQQTITLKNEEEGDPSQIQVSTSNVDVSKGDNHITINSEGITGSTGSDGTVTINTPDVAFSLNDSKKSASLTSTNGIITLTSQNGAKTSYEDNKIITEADTIIIKSKNYVETDATKKHYPHIELKSSEKSALIESKTINIFSKDSDSNTEDSIKISGSTVSITGTTTNIKTDNLYIKSNSDTDTKILILNTTSPKVDIPKGTETDINSQTIGLGDSGSNTTVSGSAFNVNTGTTNITSDTTVSGTTLLKSSSSSPNNTLEVNETSTSITGSQADINSTTVNVGTATTTAINVGRNSGDTTTLKSNKTNITSPTLGVTSGTVNFSGTNQKVAFTGTGSSLTSEVTTVAKNTTVSVKRDDTDIFKVDTSNANLLTTMIKGTKADINSTTVNIGTDTTTAINVGRNNGDTTNLKSDTTNITSPKINVGTESPSTSVKIGKTDSNVTITGNNDLSITADKTNSKVQAKDLKFTNSLSDNNIKIYWDSALQSLVFARA